MTDWVYYSAAQSFARRWKLRPHCERASPALWESFGKQWNIEINIDSFSSLTCFPNKKRLSIISNCFYICNSFRNSILSAGSFSSSLTVRVFLAFQAENLRSILIYALIGRILTNQLACQAQLFVWLGLRIFFFLIPFLLGNDERQMYRHSQGDKLSLWRTRNNTSEKLKT